MNILLLFTDQCSGGYLYLFQPVCRDGEVLLGFGGVEGEMRESLPRLWFLCCRICSLDVGSSMMSLNCWLVKVDFAARASKGWFFPSVPVVQTPDNTTGSLACSETCGCFLVLNAAMSLKKWMLCWWFISLV